MRRYLTRDNVIYALVLIACTAVAVGVMFMAPNIDALWQGTP